MIENSREIRKGSGKREENSKSERKRYIEIREQK